MSVYQTSAYRIPETADEQQALIEKVKAMYAEKRARGEIETPPSPEETLAELEQDAHAGRTVKWDVRCSPEEKLRWGQAANALGVTASEFVRDCVNSACDEVFAPEPVGTT